MDHAIAIIDHSHKEFRILLGDEINAPRLPVRSLRRGRVNAVPVEETALRCLNSKLKYEFEPEETRIPDEQRINIGANDGVFECGEALGKLLCGQFSTKSNVSRGLVSMDANIADP